MVIDSSALVVIVLGEPEAELFDGLIRASEVRLISVAALLEMTTVLSRRFEFDARPVVERAQAEYALGATPIDLRQTEIACEAMVRFGKGRHPAKLNFGDCFAYALSRAMAQPLLFKGDDFIHTDVARVL